MTFDLAKNKPLIISLSVIGALIIAIAIFLIYAAIVKSNKEKRIEREKKELREAFTINESFKGATLITAQDIENLDLTNLRISIMDGRVYHNWKHKNYLLIEGVYEEYDCKERDHVNKFLWFIFQSACSFDDSKKTIEIRGYDINKLNKDFGLDLKFKDDERGGKQGTEEDNRKLTQYVKDCQAKVVRGLKNLDLNEKQGLFDFIRCDFFGKCVGKSNKK